MHPRKRHIEKVLTKRGKIFPVLGVLGPRQVGKSTFLMNQWGPINAAAYITFDKQEMVVRAKRYPEQMLIAESNDQTQKLIIDEAQKVPHIFDSIKSLVDQKRRMGGFVLSGSVDFSSKSGVRESLAGRMGITRLYPMTMRELKQKVFASPWVNFKFSASPNGLTAKDVEVWLQRGGMPIFCSLSDSSERINLINSWLDAICYRDLKQLKDAKYDGQIANDLLIMLAVDPMISASKLASELGCTLASVKKHMLALESLFLLYKIPSFENSRAQPIYRIFDAGVLNALLGGHQTIFSHHGCCLSLLINEIYAQYEYAGKLKPRLSYYKARGGAEIDLVLETPEAIVGIDCLTRVDITPYDQRGMKSFLNKYKKAVGYFIAPVQKPYMLDRNLFVVPWHSVS